MNKYIIFYVYESRTELETSAGMIARKRKTLMKVWWMIFCWVGETNNRIMLHDTCESFKLSHDQEYCTNSLLHSPHPDRYLPSRVKTEYIYKTKQNTQNSVNNRQQIIYCIQKQLSVCLCIFASRMYIVVHHTWYSMYCLRGKGHRRGWRGGRPETADWCSGRWWARKAGRWPQEAPCWTAVMVNVIIKQVLMIAHN